jgi:hypothetical protein
MYLLVNVRTVTGNELSILMSETHYSVVKDWMFDSCQLQILSVIPAHEKGVIVK